MKRSTRESRPNGFTLIEISIVLVIIGLIIGGVLTGGDMIRRAEILRIQSRITEFTTAANAFKTKYGELPGDFANATRIWGTDPGGCPDTPASSTPKTTTCDGNGDGRITSHRVGVVISQRREMYRFFQHLANAELISGHYTGTISSPSPDAYFGYRVGLNVPRFHDDAFLMYLNYFWATSAGNPYIFGTDLGNSWFSSCNSTATGFVACGITPEELYAIDDKYDDGKPGTGRILAYKAGACVTTTNPSTASYDFNTTSRCGFYVKSGL